MYLNCAKKKNQTLLKSVILERCQEYKAFVRDNICSLGQPSIVTGTCCAVNDLPLLSFDINLLGWKTEHG